MIKHFPTLADMHTALVGVILIRLVSAAAECPTELCTDKPGAQVGVGEDVEGLTMCTVYADRVYPLWEAGKFDVVLDVRTAAEWEGDAGHIPGAYFSEDLWQFGENQQAELEKLMACKDVSILVHCHAGMRSTKTLQKFKELGFKCVFDMFDGMSKWSKRYPTNKTGPWEMKPVPDVCKATTSDETDAVVEEVVKSNQVQSSHAISSTISIAAVLLWFII